MIEARVFLIKSEGTWQGQAPWPTRSARDGAHACRLGDDVTPAEVLALRLYAQRSRLDAHLSDTTGWRISLPPRTHLRFPVPLFLEAISTHPL